MLAPGDRAGARAALALLLAAVVWGTAVVAAPRLASPATSASPARFVSAIVYGVGGVVCHQRPDRSFHTAGLRWPVCARCAGLYVSAGLAALLLLLTSPRWRGLEIGARGRLLPFLLAAAAPTAASWLGERLGLITTGNALRAVLAVPLGFAVAALMACAWAIGREGQATEVD